MNILAEKRHDHVFYADDLARVRATWSSRAGLGNFPAVVRPWIPYLVGLIKCGARTIKAPVWALTKAQGEAGARTTNSDSSTRRALAWLDREGFLRKHTFRIGKDARGVVIDINVSKFRFWLQKKYTNPKNYTYSAKINFMYSNNLHQSNCSGDEFTNNNNQLKIDSSTTDIKCINSKSHAKKHKFHPMMHTLWLLLREKDPAIWQLLSLAKKGIAGSQLDLDIDWKYWIRRWPTLAHVEREYYARSEILPKLRKKNEPSSPEPSSPEPSSPEPSSPELYKYNVNFSLEENVILAKAQNELFWARKNANLD